MSLAILTDVTRCTGCERCVQACKEANGLGEDRPWPEQGAISDLSASRFTTIIRRPGNRFVRQQCRHCVDPACASACIVGALQKTPEGAVTYDRQKCMGCRYCLMACPYGIPRYEWDEPVPYVRKCTFCYDRITQGGVPACVEACPEKATVFGTRDEMIAEAKRRLHDNPHTYVQRVYGDQEVGGTSVLYISPIPLGFLGWRDDLGDTALPDLTWASLKKVPGTIVGVAGLMTGIYWVIGRRMRLASPEAAEPDAEPKETDGDSE